MESGRVLVVAMSVVEAVAGVLRIRYMASGLASSRRISSHVTSGAAIIAPSAAQANRYRVCGLDVRAAISRAAA